MRNIIPLLLLSEITGITYDDTLNPYHDDAKAFELMVEYGIAVKPSTDKHFYVTSKYSPHEYAIPMTARMSARSQYRHAIVMGVIYTHDTLNPNRNEK